MADLYLQRKDVDVIVNFPIQRTLEDFEYLMDGMLWQYAYIVHDKDVHDKDVYEKYETDVVDLNGNIVHKAGELTGNLKFKKGELKTKHIHIVICSPKRHQLKYFLRIVVDALGVNVNQVSVIPCDNVAGRIQYLIHKNDLDKHQYSSSSIRSNLSEGVLNEYLEQDFKDNFTTDDIINICRESNGNRLMIIQKIGIARYTLYRNTINDIYKAMLYIDDKYI